MKQEVQDAPTSMPLGRLSKVVDYLRTRPMDFWGVIEIRFKDGKPVLIHEHRQIKLDDDEHRTK